jgi:restriction system protein
MTNNFGLSFYKISEGVMDSLDASEKVLQETGQPLHYKEITNRILSQNYWQTEGKTPDQTVNARIAVDIKKRGDNSRFVRTAPGVFGLRRWETTAGSEIEEISTPKYSFTDAAEFILDEFAEKRPMHYRDITDKILELALVETEGKTPEATLYAMVLTEIKRFTERGEKPRFVKYGEGMIGLRKWMGEGLAYQIEKQNREVQKKLLAYVQSLSPEEFEGLLGRLLGEMGFEDVEVTSYSGDSGIDIRGILVVGDVIRTRMAIQAKKWKNNVSSPTVREVRGSLGAHEQGMIITTSDFSKGAQAEAERSDAVPVALVNGEQLVDLLIEHEVLVKRVAYELINLDVEEEEL